MRYDTRLESIDALRGIGAVLVCIMHVYYLLGVSTDVPAAAIVVSHLGTGVQLFFIVSALTLCLTYDGKPENRVPLYFLIKRFFRIAPLFYACILLNFVSMAWGGTIYPIYSATAIATNILLVFNFVPDAAGSLTPAGWTIGVEFVFYFMFPAIAMFLHRTSILVAMFSLFLCVAVSLKLFSSSAYLQNYIFLLHLPTFLAGMLLYRVWLACRDNDALAKAVARSCGIIFSVLALAIVLKSPPAWTLHFVWSGAFLFLVLSAILYPSRILVNGLTTFLGRISYSLYLLHPLIIFFLAPIIGAHLVPSYARAVVIYSLVFSILLPLSALSQRYLEETFNRLARRLVRWIDAQRLGSVIDIGGRLKLGWIPEHAPTICVEDAPQRPLG